MSNTVDKKVDLVLFEFQLWEDAMQSVINCMDTEPKDECLYKVLNDFFQTTENLNDAIQNDPELRINNKKLF